MYKFEWDGNKNKINKIKHGISFETAASIFLDEDGIQVVDELHSTKNEERYFMIGKSNLKNILAVAYCVRFENTIRIITARKATRNEREMYEKRK